MSSTELQPFATRLIGNSILRHFARDNRGTVAVLVAAGAGVLMASAAIGIDVGLAVKKKGELQTTADLAALAGVRELGSNTAVRTEAIASARRNMPVATEGDVLRAGDVEIGTWDPTTRTFTAGDTNPNAVRVVTRRAAVSGNPLKLHFSRTLGVDDWDLLAEAIAAASGEREMALVLDVSGSMNRTMTTTVEPPDDDGTVFATCKQSNDDDDDDDDDDNNSYWSSGCSAGTWQPHNETTINEKKIDVLKRAATNLVDSMGAADTSGGNVRIAVMPFAGRVNISRHGTSWMSAMGDGNATRLCTDHRTGGNATDDSPPSAQFFPPFTLNSFACPVPRALGLTPNLDEVRTTIASLTAGGSTNSDVGIVWGWRSISERWQGLWNEADYPVAYDQPYTEKALVIMTDGENTPHQTGDSYCTAQADQRVRDMCTAIKSLGVRIFTITFDAPTSIEQLYRNCASSPDDWFNARQTTELEEAFAEIGARFALKPSLVK